jgi:hypothetical protein
MFNHLTAPSDQGTPGTPHAQALAGSAVIYMVEGHTGTCNEDSVSWTVISFTDRQRAQEYVTAANKWLEERDLDEQGLLSDYEYTLALKDFPYDNEAAVSADGRLVYLGSISRLAAS